MGAFQKLYTTIAVLEETFPSFKHYSKLSIGIMKSSSCFTFIITVLLPATVKSATALTDKSVLIERGNDLEKRQECRLFLDGKVH
jgi:hypothetical protein